MKDYGTDIQERYISESVKDFSLTKLGIQNKASVVVVQGPVAALRLNRNFFYAVFSYSEQFIVATFEWVWKIKNSQLF